MNATIAAGLLDALAGHIHAAEAAEAEASAQIKALRAEALEIMSKHNLQTHRTVWGVLSIVKGRVTKVFYSAKFQKLTADLAAERAKLESLKQYNEVVGDPYVKFIKSK